MLTISMHGFIWKWLIFGTFGQHLLTECSIVFPGATEQDDGAMYDLFILQSGINFSK